MSDKTLQEQNVFEEVTFETVVATALSYGVPAAVHNDKEFVVEVDKP